MSSRSQPPQASRDRRWIIVGALILLSAFSIVLWNSRAASRTSEISEGRAGGVTGSVGAKGLQIDDQAIEGVTSRRTRSSIRRDGTQQDLVPGQFPHVERILSDESISDSEAALSLVEIALRTDISVEERFEALAHGLNLDFRSFSKLSEDTNLPLELAQRYMDELLNFNEDPVVQLESSLGLMNHFDAEIQQQALRQLAFMVENEALVDHPIELERAALDRIKFLRENPPAQVATDESSDDLGLE